MSRPAMFWCGFVGAILPELLRFFKIITLGQALPHLNWALYGLIMAAYCPMAGLVAIAWRAESEWKAIWIGASLPAIVATLVQTAPSHT